MTEQELVFEILVKEAMARGLTKEGLFPHLLGAGFGVEEGGPGHRMEGAFRGSAGAGLGAGLGGLGGAGVGWLGGSALGAGIGAISAAAKRGDPKAGALLGALIGGPVSIPLGALAGLVAGGTKGYRTTMRAPSWERPGGREVQASALTQALVASLTKEAISPALVHKVYTKGMDTAARYGEMFGKRRPGVVDFGDYMLKWERPSSSGGFIGGPRGPAHVAARKAVHALRRAGAEMGVPPHRAGSTVQRRRRFYEALRSDRRGKPV